MLWNSLTDPYLFVKLKPVLNADYPCKGDRMKAQLVTITILTDKYQQPTIPKMNTTTIINNQNVLKYFTRLNADVNGNPRYKISASDLADLAGIDYNRSETAYDNLVKAVRKLGAGKLNTRKHPYSIKVTSYNIVRTATYLLEKLK